MFREFWPPTCIAGSSKTLEAVQADCLQIERNIDKHFTKNKKQTAIKDFFKIVILIWFIHAFKSSNSYFFVFVYPICAIFYTFGHFKHLLFRAKPLVSCVFEITDVLSIYRMTYFLNESLFIIINYILLYWLWETYWLFCVKDGRLLVELVNGQLL